MQTFRYETISKAWPTKFLTSYSDSLLLAARNAVGLAAKFCVKRVQLQNRSGSTVIAGFGGRLPIDLWKAGQWTNGNTTYIEDTTDAQDAGANDFALTTTTNNDGIIVLSKIPFNLIDVIVGTAAAGGSPAYDFAYSLAGGTWSTIAVADMHVGPAFAATGENLIWWDMPTNWGLTESGHATGIPTGYYGVRMRATTAPNATAALATNLVLGVIIASVDSLADDGLASWDPEGSELELPPQCDGLALCMSVAGKQSQVNGLYRLAG